MTDDNILRREVPPGDLVNNFNYRTYLHVHGWNGSTGFTDSPLNDHTPRCPLVIVAASMVAFLGRWRAEFASERSLLWVVPPA